MHHQPRKSLPRSSPRLTSCAFPNTFFLSGFAIVVEPLPILDPLPPLPSKRSRGKSWRGLDRPRRLIEARTRDECIYPRIHPVTSRPSLFLEDKNENTRGASVIMVWQKIDEDRGRDTWSRGSAWYSIHLRNENKGRLYDEYDRWVGRIMGPRTRENRWPKSFNRRLPPCGNHRLVKE